MLGRAYRPCLRAERGAGVPCSGLAFPAGLIGETSIDTWVPDSFARDSSGSSPTVPLSTILLFLRLFRRLGERVDWSGSFSAVLADVAVDSTLAGAAVDSEFFVLGMVKPMSIMKPPLV